MEAAAVPSQLLGELFVEKGLITPEELEEALAEQKVSGKRIGEILVKKGYVSGPSLTTVLAEQLGVQMEKQEGFGAGLWSEIRKRHLRGRGTPELKDADELPEPLIPYGTRFAVIDGLGEEMEVEPAADEPSEDEPDELDGLRQQLAFSAARLDEERSAHDGTRRLLEEARSETGALEREVDDWRERAAAAQGQLEERGAADQTLEQLEELRRRSEDAELALEDARTAAAAFEASLSELRGELEARDRELTSALDAQASLEETVAGREAELAELRELRKGSEDAIAALTTQVDVLRAAKDQAQATIDQLRSEASATAETIAGLREEVTARSRASEGETALRADLAAVTERLEALRAMHEETQRALVQARGDADAAESAVADLRAELSAREEAQAAIDQLRSEASATAETIAGLREMHEETQRALVQARGDADAAESAVADLRAELSAREEELSARTEGELEARRTREAELQRLQLDSIGLTEALEAERAQLAALVADFASAREHAASLEQIISELRSELSRKDAAEQAQQASLDELRATLAERAQAVAREAEGRADVERQLAELGAHAEGLGARLDEERAARVATREELERAHAELTDLRRLTDKVATTEAELASCARMLDEVSAGLSAAKTRPDERDEGDVDTSRHLVFMPVEGVYALAERTGPAPDVGAHEELDGVRFRVTRIGSSPLPSDTRRCAFLEVA